MPSGRAVSDCVLRAALIAAVVACASADGAPAVVQNVWRTVRETRGDTAVVRTVGIGRDSSRVRLVEEISIGKLDGSANEAFSAINRVRPTPDGGLILTDGSGSREQIKMFNRAGTFVRNIGRGGDGPGEYRSLNGIAVAPRGEVLAWGRGGVNVYAPNGDYKNTWTGGSFPAQFVDSQGRVYSEATMNDPDLPDSIVPPAGRRVQRNIAVRTSLEGVVFDTIVSPRARISRRLLASASNGVPANRIVTPQPGQFVAYPTQYAIPYVPQFFSVLSPLGYYVAGDAEHYAVNLKTAAGRPMRIESDRAAVPIDAQERRARYDYIRAKTDDIAPSDIAQSKPFFKYLRADDDGRIWVWLYHASVRIFVADTVKAATAGTSRYMWVEAVVYDVFAPTGEFLGSVRFPERAAYAAAKGDKLWLVLTDELDVPRVVRYRIEGFK